MSSQKLHTYGWKPLKIHENAGMIKIFQLPILHISKRKHKYL